MTLPACCEMATIVYRQTISTMNEETCDVKSLLAAQTVRRTHANQNMCLIDKLTDLDLTAHKPTK